MRVLQLTRLAKARVWFHEVTPGFVSAGSVTKRVDANQGASVERAHVTLEAFVPRGGYAQYGLVGIDFERVDQAEIEVQVHYSSNRNDRWADSLGKQVDDVWLGLPVEYAGPILDSATDFATHRFPPGTIRIMEAAHGLVGSSADFFRKLTTAALTVMLAEHQRDDDEMIAFLRGKLVE